MINIFNFEAHKHKQSDKVDVQVQLNRTKERLKQILGGKENKDCPFLVISMAGTRRCGKSFLANLFISYLKYLSEVCY